MNKSKHPAKPSRSAPARRGHPLDLSVCFIARDEEHNLPRALASVRTVAQELIVVDTGSHDRTPQIAKEHGATVVHHPWRDHFAEARNAALELATSTWILMLDADEELTASSVPALARALSSPAQAQVVLVHHIAPAAADSRPLPPPPPGGLTGRRPTGAAGAPLRSLLLFRRHPGIRYHGRVHETIVDSLLRLDRGDWPYSGVQIAHYGYQEAEERQRKGQRNLRLLELAVSEEPDNLYLKLKLAQTLGAGPRQRAVLEDAVARAALLPAEAAASLPFLPRLLALAGAALLSCGALRAAQGLALGLGLQLGPGAAFTVGRLSVCSGALAEGEAALARYLEGAWQQGGASLVLPDPEASPAAALHLLGFSVLSRGQPGPAANLLRRARAAAVETPFDWGHPAAIDADLLRCQLQQGQRVLVAEGLDRLAEGLQSSSAEPRRRRETMLAAGELALQDGDLAGALPLLEAALDPSGQDDRAAALCALTQLHLTPKSPALAAARLPLIPGGRYDTLAVRLLLGELIPALAADCPPAADAPAATLRVLEALRQRLPPALRPRPPAQ